MTTTEIDRPITADEIRDLFRGNWVFKLYMWLRQGYWCIAILLPVVFLLFGLALSAVLGVTSTFSQNILAYNGPAGMILALVAYGWFAREFPEMIVKLYPALGTSREEVLNIVKKWADRIANRIAVIGGVSLLFFVVAFVEMSTSWSNPNLSWPGTSWVNSSQSLFFALYYGCFSVLSGGVLLGSGLVGLIGFLFVIFELLRIPLKLQYYRRLNSVSAISTGISFWTLVAFVGILVSSFYLKSNALLTLQASSIGLSVLASVAFLIVLLAPILIAWRAIRRAKMQALTIFEKRLQDVSEIIEKLIKENTSQTASGILAAADELEKLRKEREELRHEISEVEAVPSWPLEFLGLLQIIGASLVPIVSVLWDSALSKLMP